VPLRRAQGALLAFEPNQMAREKREQTDERAVQSEVPTRLIQCSKVAPEHRSRDLALDPRLAASAYVT